MSPRETDALMDLTRVMVKRAGDVNITVKCIAPGLLLTPEVLGNRSKLEARRHNLAQRQAIRRPQAIDDFADDVVFLAPDAARFITGQAPIVDGGMYFY